MLYIINAFDKPGMAETVAATLDAHRHYLHESEKALILAGGMLDESGKQRRGSVYLINVPNRAAAEAWLAAEPFHKAGIFASVSLERMRKGHWHPENAPKTAEGD